MVPQPYHPHRADGGAEPGTTTLATSAGGTMTVTVSRTPPEPLRVPILRRESTFVPPPTSAEVVEMRLRLAAQKRARQAARQGKGMRS